jgi:hypothetical protein
VVLMSAGAKFNMLRLPITYKAFIHLDISS